MAEFPSRRTKKSIKTALALVIAYGLALEFGWDKPQWAGIAVIFCSLATIGQSFTKSVYRMCGTLLAASMSLLLIALFPQERWLFMAGLSAFIGLCTYMMGPKQQYFWNVAGFVTAIICMKAGADPANAFHIAVLRTQETALGILVYSVISLLLWPASSGPAFIASVGDQISKQRELVIGVLQSVGQPEPTAQANYAPLQAQTVQAQAQLKQLLEAAQADTTKVKEHSAAWQSYSSLVFQLTEAVERLSHGFAELEKPAVAAQLPDLSDFISVIEQRFNAMEQMQQGNAPSAEPSQLTDWTPNPERLNALPHFQRAAIVIAYQRLATIDRLSHALLEQLAGITQFGPKPAAISPTKPPLTFDIDRGLSAAQVMLTLWIAWLAFIYIDALPSGTVLITVAGSVGMVCATAPQLPIRKLIAPLILSLTTTGLIYLWIMPRLSGFAELGALLFIATFAFCYLFDAPQQMLNRVYCLSMLVSITSVSNEQTYSFSLVASIALIFPILFLILLLTANVPFSPRPERAILRLLRRFFKSYHILVETPPPTGNFISTWLRRQVHNFHRNEVTALPAKMNAWAQALDTEYLTGTDKSQVMATLNSVQVLSDRMNELTELRLAGQTTEQETEIKADFAEWRDYSQTIIHHLSKDPTASDYQQVQDQLSAIQKNLETRMTEIAKHRAEHTTELKEVTTFYTRLGIYRGLSEALLNYTKQTDAINWTPWKEERFY